MIPDSIRHATPAGDMYDGRTDEEVFGASYDFVELYLSFLNDTKKDQEAFLKGLSDKGFKQFKFYQSNLEELHRYNAHKYLGKSPSVHLDLFDSSIKGGWDNHKMVIDEIFK